MENTGLEERLCVIQSFSYLDILTAGLQCWTPRIPCNLEEHYIPFTGSTSGQMIHVITIYVISPQFPALIEVGRQVWQTLS